MSIFTRIYHSQCPMDNDKHFGKIFSISILYSIILSSVYIILYCLIALSFVCSLVKIHEELEAMYYCILKTDHYGFERSSKVNLSVTDPIDRSINSITEREREREKVEFKMFFVKMIKVDNCMNS